MRVPILILSFVLGTFLLGIGRMPMDGTTSARAIAVGLTPKALAACGVNATQAAAVLGAIHDASDQSSALDAANAAVDTARAAFDTSVAQCRADPTNLDLRAVRATRRSDLGTAFALVEAKKAELRQAGTQGLSAQTQVLIELFVSRATLRVPDQYRLASEAGIVWSDVEQAVIAQARSQRLGSTLEGAQADLLTTLNSDSRVVAAGQNLSSLLADVAQAFQ
jgi:hypothetical protein